MIKLDLLDLLVLALSMLSAVPLICRLAVFDRGHHAARIAILHGLLSASVAWVGVKAWQGQADVGGLCTVLAALAWIWISYHSWRHGVPRQFHRRRCSDSDPQVLDVSAMRQAWGRGPE